MLDGQIVQWVDNEVMMITFGQQVEPSPSYEEAAWYNDGFRGWQWFDDKWQTWTDDGWAAFSEMRPWPDIEDILFSDPGTGKEVQDLYAAFDQMVRTFREARDAVHFKGKSRCFWRSPPQGKGKGKPKGFGKGKKGGTPQILAVQGIGQGSPQKGGKGSPTAKPGYTGCFICSSLDHDWRNCPRRGQSSAAASSSGGKSRPICMVSAAECFMVSESDKHEEDPGLPKIVNITQDIQRLILAATPNGCGERSRLGYGVIDTGATETVGS